MTTPRKVVCEFARSCEADCAHKHPHTPLIVVCGDMHYLCEDEKFPCIGEGPAKCVPAQQIEILDEHTIKYDHCVVYWEQDYDDDVTIHEVEGPLTHDEAIAQATRAVGIRATVSPLTKEED